MEGTVKFFNELKNFGFIDGEDGKSYFVHASALAEGLRLREGDKVTFDPEEGDKGPKAVNVRKSEGGAAPKEEAPAEESAEEAEETAEDE